MNYAFGCKIAIRSRSYLDVIALATVLVTLGLKLGRIVTYVKQLGDGSEMAGEIAFRTLRHTFSALWTG